MFVFYVPSTARSFRDSTPIYCPLPVYKYNHTHTRTHARTHTQTHTYIHIYSFFIFLMSLCVKNK